MYLAIYIRIYIVCIVYVAILCIYSVLYIPSGISIYYYSILLYIYIIYLIIVIFISISISFSVLVYLRIYNRQFRIAVTPVLPTDRRGFLTHVHVLYVCVWSHNVVASCMHAHCFLIHN